MINSEMRKYYKKYYPYAYWTILICMTFVMTYLTLALATSIMMFNEFGVSKTYEIQNTYFETMRSNGDYLGIKFMINNWKTGIKMIINK